ncbi:MAG: Gfo/Idh/MocA family oxidoreductase, partial [Acetobacteraceae bacterium]|nr:Gfo/Idh/MocA family oxidoreductase [Acetobacteraceae bacterium]
ETDDCQVVAIADPSPAALARAGKRHPLARLLTDPAEVFKQPDIDAVAIATPVRTHYDLARAALRSGRHVLVEKPMTETSDQGVLLVEEAARRNLVLMAGHTFVYSPAVRKIQELVSAGDLGQIFYYDSTRINLGLFQRDVDVIWDLAVHDLSILEFVLRATPSAVSANGVSHVKGSPENMAQVTLYFEDCVAHLNVNWLAPVKIRQVLIGGSRKMIVYDDLEPSEKIKVYDRGINVAHGSEEIYRMLVSYRVGDMWAPQLATTEPLLTETSHFVSCIRDRITPITDGRLGLRVVEVLEAATRSMRQRGQPVELGRPRMAS